MCVSRRRVLVNCFIVRRRCVFKKGLTHQARRRRKKIETLSTPQVFFLRIDPSSAPQAKKIETLSMPQVFFLKNWSIERAAGAKFLQGLNHYWGGFSCWNHDFAAPHALPPTKTSAPQPASPSPHHLRGGQRLGGSENLTCLAGGVTPPCPPRWGAENKLWRGPVLEELQSNRHKPGLSVEITGMLQQFSVIRKELHVRSRKLAESSYMAKKPPNFRFFIPRFTAILMTFRVF